ncbi:DUF2796 domain-containing protein [Cocleimonas sp. KMM 6892]|uniref:DUF2796 domain-containing protein n=1 Tax=unclassified Cocleimonas TaxID=2639732 RepID=UPI002DB977B6|nr:MULTISPECIES: DUF2796 domain-containing protein [unclassified Cocleimonas]MEB8433532.1 DUF2796 domain-containing protein [Cocleimonas sp. KMM 6892]MEC4716343.1 DUF2796 domain-containing protein [Cocleimonas sp. KMM 6895]MEC4745764.1 DUF2796 domain-containing protein [Cocleimonas sp. KMM 6896]
MKTNAASSLTSVVLSSMALTVAISTSTIASEDEHREHGAHQHGKAQLNVIQEKSELAIMLETPAMNVFGFEHEPKNSEQKEIVEHAVKDLKKLSTLIEMDKNAACEIVKVDVDQPFGKHDEDEHEDEHEHEHEEKDEHDHDDEHKEKNELDEKHEEQEESTHSDIDVEVVYNCKNATKLTQLDLSNFFKRFSGFEDIDAQIIVNGQQSATELSKKQPILTLKK